MQFEKDFARNIVKHVDLQTLTLLIPYPELLMFLQKMWLTHFRPMFHFYTPWKYQKTSGGLTFLGCIEMDWNGLNHTWFSTKNKWNLVKQVIVFVSFFEFIDTLLISPWTQDVYWTCMLSLCYGIFIVHQVLILRKL